MDDDSVASGDDSAGWEEEDERMRLQVDANHAISEDSDDISEDDGPVKEVEEFMLIAGGGEDGEDVVDNFPPVEPEFEMV